ncbi:hypothetical protein V8E52_001915 [Russula decolorans]
MDNDDNVFGPDDLLRETRTLTGLRSAYFSSPPHWIKPTRTERSQSNYWTADKPSSANKSRLKEPNNVPDPRPSIGNSVSVVIPDTKMAGPPNTYPRAGPSNTSPRDPSPCTDLAGPGLSPEEASVNAARKIVKQLAAAGNTFPTLRELTARDHNIHNEETRRRFAIGPGSGTTWDSVAEVDYFIEGERLAGLPNGYFYPLASMPAYRRAQLAAVVPKSITHPATNPPSNTPTPGSAGNQPAAPLC